MLLPTCYGMSGRCYRPATECPIAATDLLPGSCYRPATGCPAAEGPRLARELHIKRRELDADKAQVSEEEGGVG
eukprot:165935-Rhodomonas_salina.1